MLCPRCGNEWDTSKGSCANCGFAVRTPSPLYTQPIRPAGGSNGSLQGGTWQVRSALHPSTDGHHPYAANHTSLLGRTPPLPPGALLHAKRYRLQELRERQDWPTGVYEATWVGQDSHRTGLQQVMLCEVGLPEYSSAATQAILQMATKALITVGRYPHIPALWDAFGEQGRGFFVFEPIEGASLRVHMRQRGRTFQEQEVIECLLQMLEVLELLAQQSPPLVHGLIRPEHIIKRSDEAQYVLSHFSVVIAGGAKQYVSGIERGRPSPYIAPEASWGNFDVRSDLYALLASAYYAVTGREPGGWIPSTQQFAPFVSPQLGAILSKGLLQSPSQRYQSPAELRQDVSALRGVHGAYAGRNQSPYQQLARNTHSPLIPAFLPGNGTALSAEMRSYLDPATPAKSAAHAPLLPRPEDLPQMRPGNTTLHSFYALAGILTLVILIVVLSQVG